MAIGGSGIKLTGTKSYLYDMDIKEIENHEEDIFFDESNYGAVGLIYAGDDNRVLWGEIGWCDTGVLRQGQDGGNVNLEIIETHIFGGMEGYQDRNKDGSTRVANPGGVPAVGRDAVLLELERSTTPGKWLPFKATGCYFDNGKIVVHDDDGVSFHHCEFNTKTAASMASSDVWIENICLAKLKPDGTPIGGGDVIGVDFPDRPYGVNNLVVTNAVCGVQNGARKLVTWLPNPDTGEDWVFNPSDYEASDQNLVTERGQVYNLSERYNYYSSVPVAARWRAQGVTGWLEVLGRDGLGARLGARTDDAVLAADGAFIFEELDGTNLARLARGGFLPPRRTADPTGVALGTIYYNTSTGKLRLLSAIGWVSLN